MSCLPCDQCDIPEAGLSIHRMILQILNLVVAFTTHNAEMQTLRITQRHAANADAKSLARDSIEGSRRALEAVNTVVDATLTVAHSILQQIAQVPSIENHASP